LTSAGGILNSQVHPKLIALSGPLAGSTFTLPEKEGTVGRAPYNWLSIPSSTVSRQHFQFELASEGWKIRDLDSHNGTLVNDAPARERLLNNGDQIRAGDSEFVFVTEEEDLPRPSANLADTDLHTLTLYSREAESTLLQPPPEQAPPAEQRMRALLRLSAALQSALDRKTLGGQLTSSVMEMLDAERVFVFWREHGGVTEIASAIREGIHRAAVPGTVLEMIWVSGKSLLGEAGTVRWVTAPLLVSGRPSGALYVEAAKLLEEHLDLVTAVATFSALAVDQLMRLEDLRVDNKLLREAAGLAHEMIGESAVMKRIY